MYICSPKIYKIGTQMPIIISGISNAPAQDERPSRSLWHWPHAEKCEPSHVASQPRDAAYPLEGPLWQPSVLGSSVESSAAGRYARSSPSQQPPLRPLGRVAYAAKVHLAALAQYLDHDHHISHLNLIKNMYFSNCIIIFEKSKKNHKIKNSYRSHPMLHLAVILGLGLLGNPAQNKGSHRRR